MPVDVRPGQLWEFANGAAPIRRAHIVRVSLPIDGVRYVFLKRVGSGRPMRTTLHRLQYQQAGARLAEDAPATPGDIPEPITVKEVAPARAKVHQPRMTAEDRREAVAQARRLRARGLDVAEIAESLCVSAAVIRMWLAEPG